MTHEHRATDAMRDSAAVLVNRRCGDGFGCKMRGGENLDDRSQSACRLNPEMSNQPNRDRRSKEPLLTSTEPSLSLRRVNPPV
jgi:hypothetical protein